AEVGQIDALATDAQRQTVLERGVRGRAGRVVVAQQQPAVLGVPDPFYVSAEQRRGSDVVGVVVRVDDVGDLVGHAVSGGDVIDGALQVVPDARRRVEQHDTVLG